MKDARAEWLEKVRVKESEPHEHQWQVYSGSTDGHFRVYCWCGARAFQSFSGKLYNIAEPPPEVRTRRFEGQLWEEEHSS